MTISDRDMKLLWGRAAGICSHPECNEDLTAILESGGGYTIGEMAHIIGRMPTAARGTSNGGPDTYANLILLCPNHHSHIDKSPAGMYTERMLHGWKHDHEAKIRLKGKDHRFSSFCELCKVVRQILAENKAIFDAFGPKSDTASNDPMSNLASVWTLRRINKIVPNNLQLMNLLKANYDLLPNRAIDPVERFKVHALAYENHVYEPLDRYPRFPVDFAEIFNGE